MLTNYPQNWFQNRRAREKKENNIREYEAKQRLEKEQAEAGDCRQSEDGRHCDLVGSSAPFPQPAVTLRQSIEESPSPSEQSCHETMSETNETSQSVETDFPSLLAHPAKQEASDANDPGPGPGYSCFPLQKCKPVVEDTDALSLTKWTNSCPCQAAQCLVTASRTSMDSCLRKLWTPKATCNSIWKQALLQTLT